MPIYLKLGNVRGESKAKGHEGWIELNPLSLGRARKTDPDDTSGDVFCSRKVDSTSVTLHQLSADGKVQSATIDFVDPQGKIYLQLQFQDALIASHSFSGTANSGPLVETFTLAYLKMTVVRFSVNAPDTSANLLQNLLSAPVP